MIASRHFYGAVATVTGVWELAALTGRVPTVSRTVRAACRRWPVFRFAVCLYTAGLTRHLLDPKTVTPDVTVLPCHHSLSAEEEKA